MDTRRLLFAAKHAFNRTPIVCSFAFVNIVLGVWNKMLGYSWSYFFVAMLIVMLCLTHAAYWMRFYYLMYRISEICTDPFVRTVSVGHLTAFYRHADSLRGCFAYEDNPNAILYGDILVVAQSSISCKHIEETLREDRALRGLRWNNNFPFGKGVYGYVSKTGSFHQFDADRLKDILAYKTA